MALQLVIPSKSMGRSRVIARWQNLLALLVLFLMPLQRHFRFRSFEDSVLSKQDSYNTLFFSVITPLVIAWLLLQGFRLFYLKKTEFRNVFWAISPIILAALTLGSHKMLGYFHLYRIGEFAILLGMFWNWIESEGPEKVRAAFFKSAIVLGIFESIVILMQFFSGKSLGLRILGETRFDIGKATTSFLLTTPRLLLDSLRFLDFPSQFIRAPGTAPHPNIMGGIIAIYLLMTLCNELGKEKRGIAKASKWKTTLVLSLLFVALLLTFSRSALFGFGLGAVLFSGWAFYKKMIPRKAVLYAGVLFILSVPFMLARGGILFNSTQIIKECNEERLYMVVTAWKMFLNSPIFGQGSGEYIAKVVEFPTHLGKVVHLPVHNILLLILAEMGLVGVISIAILLRRYLIFKLPKTAMEWGALSSVIAILFIANIDHYLLSFPEGRVLTAVVFSWYALEFHFSRRKFLESSSPK